MSMRPELKSWRFRTGLRMVAMASGLVCALGVPAASADDSSDKVEQVVVTATRTGAENLQNVPMSISVVNVGDLTRGGVNSLSDFENTVPSLSVQEIGPGQNSIAIRGVVDPNGIDSTNPEDQALVSVYLDDTPISLQSATPDLKVFDLQRIEIIRGPQGTLYGAGAMAGTIRYITQKPDANSYFGYAEGVLSDTDEGASNYSVRGMANIPLAADTLGLMISGYKGRDSGYIDNIGDGKNNANSVGTTQFRAAARYFVNKDFTVDASVIYSDIRANGNNTAYRDLGNGHNEYSTLTPEGLKDRLAIYNLTAAYDLGFANLTSSTSYTNRRLENDQSFEIAAYLYIFGYRVPSPDVIVNKIRDFSQEIRLNSSGDGPFKWIAGAFYDTFHRHYTQNDITPGVDAFIGIPSTDLGAPVEDDLFYGLEQLQQRQFAVFGQVTYTIVPNLDLTAGVRYFDDSQTYSNLFGGIAGALAPGMPLYQIGTGKATGFNPRFAASYHINEDTMLFAEAARGFRLGGVNQPVPPSFCGAALAAQNLTSAPETFGPDSLWSYTIGEKSTIADGRATLNVSGFYVDWKNMQTNDDLNCGYYFTENAGEVTSKGVEVESTARLTSNLTMNFSGSYTDAEAATGIPNLQAVEGDPVPYFPAYMGNLSFIYDVPVGDADLLMQVDGQHRSSFYNSFNTTTKLDLPSSSTINAAVTYSMGSWEVGIFGRNLTDDHVVTSASRNTNGAAQPGDAYTYARPRTIGIRARVNF